MDLFDRPAHDASAAEPWMKRNLKPLVVGLATLVALVLTVTRRDAYRLKLAAGEPSVAAPSGDRRPYDLSSLHIFHSTLMRISDAYVDPERVAPKQMLLAALDQVQKQVPEILVEPNAGENRVTVRVDTAQKDFAIGDVDSPWTLSLKMRDVFRFVSQHLGPGADLKEVEYNAINGMLSTLDPHSLLLDPQQYGEMKLTTRGQFGGLGIVIGLRKNKLTVIRPLPGTPAWNAGIKAGDRIVKIERESTDNMMLNDAVSRLRGEPDSKVEVWVQRGTEAAKKHVLTRAVVSVNSVQAQLLKGNIGYVKLTQFSGNTAEEMHRYLEEMKAKSPGGLKGIVLDLRNDPGGLLDQAIKVADEFLDSGTIVTTVGYANKQRDEKRAKADGTQPHLPMAVLVNPGSASASEIVAGALKNLDRAVIIGNRTFGKGSVQVLYDNEDGSALKLTIAQYLTPGDVSIQSVGIVPDIGTEPTMITKERISLFRKSHNMREQDLDAHLVSRNARAGDKPAEILRYLSEQAAKRHEKAMQRDEEKDKEGEPAEEPEDDEPIEDPDDGKFVEDYEITLARDLVAQARGWRRREILAGAKSFFEKKSAEEQQKIADGLRALGIDWSTGPRTPPRLEATVSTDKPGDTVRAGETIRVTMNVTNRGPQPAYQVRAITRSEDPYLEDREFVFGKIAPGETRSWSVPIKFDRAALPRMGRVRFEVFDDGGTRAGEARMTLRVDGSARPRYAYSYQLIDDIKGNGDGLVQPGESVRLHVTVRNVGEGKSYETMSTLTSKSGDGLAVNKGRFDLTQLAPGAEKSVDFSFDVRPDFTGNEVAVEMNVYDLVMREFVTDKLTFPIAPSSGAVAASGTVTVTADQVALYAGAGAQSQVIGHARKGAAFRVTGKAASFYRIEVEPGRPAFLASNMAAESRSPAQPSANHTLYTPSLQVMPPRLKLDNPPLLVEQSSFKLRGAASDETAVTEVYAFVSNRASKIEHRKVFYQSNRKGKDPKNVGFEANIPVWPGVNTVTVVARKSNQVQSQQTLVVLGPPAKESATAQASQTSSSDY